MDKASSVDILDGCQHLEQNVASDHLSKLFSNIFLEVGYVRSFQIHYEKVLSLLLFSVYEL